LNHSRIKAKFIKIKPQLLDRNTFCLIIFALYNFHNDPTINSGKQRAPCMCVNILFIFWARRIASVSYSVGNILLKDS